MKKDIHACIFVRQFASFSEMIVPAELKILSLGTLVP